MAAHWNQRRKTRSSSALCGDIVERAGGFIGSREAGSRGRGGHQEPTAWASRAPRRVRIPHLGRSTSVGQRCTHANDIRKRRAATSEASWRALESFRAVISPAQTAESPAQPRGASVRRPFRLISYVSMPAAWCRFRVCLLHAAAPVVCCILCVASVPCCALVVENNASRMLLVVRFPPLAAHGMRRCRVFPCCISHVLASSCMSSAD